MVKKATCLFFLFCFISGAAYGQDRFPFLGKIIADNVNVRAGQSVNFEKLSQLDKGDNVVVVGRKYSWYEIRLPENSTVYVSKDFIERSIGRIYIITGNRVNLRAGPGGKYSVLAQLNKGTRVEVKKIKGQWAQIEPMQGINGWVSERFVEFDSYQVPPPKIIKEPARNIYARPEKKKPVTMLKPVKKKPQRSLVKKEEREDQFSIVGRVEDLGRVVPPKDITYKLVIDDETAYYLQGSRYLIDSFLYYKVRVYGKIKDDPNNRFQYPVIVVSKIKLIL